VDGTFGLRVPGFVTRLPAPRGDLGTCLHRLLRAAPDPHGPPIDVKPSCPEDAALSLWVLHELAYGGFVEADDDHERNPRLLALRAELEDDLEDRLRAAWPGPPDLDFVAGFAGWLEEWEGPSLARFIQTHAHRHHADQLLRLRTVYHLKEADPTTWVIPRLPVAAKSALAELQYDEYGVGDPARLHSHLFAVGMEASGLDPEYGAYLDEVPLEVLEQNNAVSMFGLQRRLRGAAVGHLAAFEATSSMPSRRVAQGLERLDYPEEMVRYYREHVEADAVHEHVAIRNICGGLLRAEPGLAADVWFGAWACLHQEDEVARRLLDEWQEAAG
jgi:hypothetical protein